MAAGSMGIGPLETAPAGIESSDSSFVTIDRGTHSGIHAAITEVYRAREDFELFWARHSSDSFPPPAPPAVDFSARMVVAVFMGEQVTGGFTTEVTSVEQKEDGGIVVNFTTDVPRSGAIVTQALTQPYHIVSVGKTDQEVTFEGSEATKAAPTTTVIPLIMTVFKKDADYATTVERIKEGPAVKQVQELKSLNMAFVTFESGRINKDDALAFLNNVEGVESVEEDR